MATSLEQLKKFTTVVADTGDIKRMLWTIRICSDDAGP
jgi:hypothetical protein